MASNLDLYHELLYYTLAHPDPSFIHQHVVDAYGAQHANEATRPIRIVFSLIGLYLYVEKEFTGRQVQKAHTQLANRRKHWLRPNLPQKRAAIEISDVLAAAPGQERDAMIRKWCVSVWEIWKESRDQIVDLARSELNIG